MDMVSQTNERSATTSGTVTVLRVCIQSEETESLLERINLSPNTRIAQTELRDKADIQILDWRVNPRNNTPILENSNLENAEYLHLHQDLPTLILINEHTDLHRLFESSLSLDYSFLEFVSEQEIGSALFDARMLKLKKLGTDRANRDPLNENGAVILEAVMKHSNDWMTLKSLDHKFLLASDRFCQEYGKSPSEIIGKNDLEIGTNSELVLGKPGTDWKGYWELDKEVTDSGEPTIVGPTVLGEDHEAEIHESTIKIPLRDRNGDVFALLVCVSELIWEKANKTDPDASANSAIQKSHFWKKQRNLSHSPALMALNNEREQAQAQQLETERAFIAKNQFIAAASHDLRQPLHALGLYLGALEENVDEGGLYLVEKVKKCAESVNDLLDSLLDISRLDANVVSAEQSTFPIDDVVYSLRDECISIANGKSLDLFCRTDGSPVYSDPILLRRVVRNLLINAINYTEQGKISISAQKYGSRVLIIVSDTGIGIPADKQELVFEEFAKLKSKSKEIQQGLGLGLSIVKRLCLLLDIEITMESVVGEGTRISLFVPLGNSIATHNSRSGVPDDLNKGITHREEQASTVLVLDDEQEVCEAVETILKKYGYNVVSATSISRAIEKLQNPNPVPDVILVDFRLSENTTGLDAIEAISQHLETEIPAIIITGDTTEDGLMEITHSGFRHLHKPVNVELLLENVEQIVNPVAQS